VNRRPILRRLAECRSASQRSAAEAEMGYRSLLGEIEAATSLDYVIDLYEQAADGLAQLLERLERSSEAVAAYRRVLDRAPTSAVAHAGLSRLAFPGDEYKAVLTAIHASLHPGFYLEIGVFEGETLRLAGPECFACGVDPQPIVRFPLGPNVRLFTETSDAFFAAWPARPEIAARAIDFAFIDGLHSFEQTLRDFINVERHAGASTLAIIHDCVPVDAVVAERTQRSVYWTGDVWKLLPILWEHRPDLAIEVVSASPSGLVVVRNLDPRSEVLAQRFDAIVAAHMASGYDRFVAEVQPRIKFIRSDAAAIAHALQAGRPL
jgi:hypothetical protein